ncbi:MAG: transporter substrate-binding domain-containing protein [Desulfobacterales bacterium]|nr:transporter substrate-binding domain-containing protein [Desulfobacterales bacterium]
MGSMMNVAARWTIAGVLAGLLLAAAPVAAGESLTVYYFHRPPYYETDEAGQAGGFLVEITRLILSEAQVPFQFEEMPHKRILSRLREHRRVSSPGWFKTPERQRFARFSQPIYRNRPLCIIINRQLAPRFEEAPEMARILSSDLTLGVLDEFSYGLWADGQMARFKPKTYRLAGSQGSLLEMVLRSRVDYMLIAMEEAMNILARNDRAAVMGRIVRIADAPEGNQRPIMFSLGVDEQTVTKIDSAIERVRVSEPYARIVRAAEGP